MVDSRSREPRSAARVLAWAGRADRALTWGMDPVEREDLLRERGSDRLDQLLDGDATVTHLAIRSLKSVVADIWYRFFESEASSVPLALMFLLVGIGALADAFTVDFPGPVRILDLSTALGFFTMAVAGFRRPHALHRKWLLPGLVLASVGAIGGAIAVPLEPGTEVLAIVNKGSFGIGGIGLAVIALALIPKRPSRTWVRRGGTLVWGAAVMLAVGQIGWVAIATPVYSTRSSSLIVGAAAVVGAAVIGRIRHMPVVA